MTGWTFWHKRDDKKKGREEEEEEEKGNTREIRTHNTQVRK